MKHTGKLDQLTALRFFAALMIVFHHSIGLFGITDIGVNLGQGVTFFFVLSGFILTYVYPSLETFPEIKKFWRARIARIWPAYVASFVIGFVLIPYAWNTKTAIANLLMVQSWIPLSTYYFSYNALAWSVSTEAFFYLMFPLLLWKWSRSWKVKLLMSAVLLLGMMCLAGALHLPDYGDPNIGKDGLLMTQHGLIYINPLSRLFEFVFGMTLATIWKKHTSGSGLKLATFYELGSIAVCGASLYYGNRIAQLGMGLPFGDEISLWLVQSGSVFSFGLLIYVMAQGSGAVSRLLSHRSFVLLGEISFSLYMIHQILLQLCAKNLSTMVHLPNAIAFITFVVILLLSSYLMWVCIEMPGRRWLLGHSKIHGTPAMRASWRDNLPKKKVPIFAGVILLGLIALMNFSAKKQIQTIDEVTANHLTPEKMKPYLGASFQGVFGLKGLNVECDGTNIVLELAWVKTGESKGLFTNAIHLVDAGGNILGQADYKQPDGIVNLEPGTIWLDKVTIPAGKIKDGVSALAVGIYDASGKLLLITNAKTDWGGRRMIISLDQCMVNHSTGRSSITSGSSSDAQAVHSAVALEPLTASELNVPQITTAASCNIEALGNKAFVTDSLNLGTPDTTISGWVLPEISKRSGIHAELHFMDKALTSGWKVQINNWIPRPDVTSAMHGADSVNVGFMQKVDLSVLPHGQYHVIVTFQDAGKDYSCDKGRMINAL